MTQVITASVPVYFQPVPGASFLNAPKVLAWLLLPMTNSQTIIGMQRKSMHRR